MLEMIGENVIPEGKYLVLGDNRPISKDSRIIGLIDEKDIKGYTSIILFPFISNITKSVYLSISSQSGILPAVSKHV